MERVPLEPIITPPARAGVDSSIAVHVRQSARAQLLASDIIFSDITMRDIRNAPLFLRLGARLRGPKGHHCRNAQAGDRPWHHVLRAGGIPGHAIEDLSISNVFLAQKGGGADGLTTVDPPEQEKDYPEPSRFAALPAQALFVRHAKAVDVNDVAVASDAADARPACWLDDVDGARFFRLRLPRNASGAAFLLKNTRNFRVAASGGVPDTALDMVVQKSLP